MIALSLFKQAYDRLPPVAMHLPRQSLCCRKQKAGRIRQQGQNAHEETHARGRSARGWLSACNTDFTHSSVGLLAPLMARRSAGLDLVKANRMFNARIFVRLFVGPRAISATS